MNLKLNEEFLHFIFEMEEILTKAAHFLGLTFHFETSGPYRPTEVKSKQERWTSTSAIQVSARISQKQFQKMNKKIFHAKRNVLFD